MRSAEIFRALDQISNRFTLCQVICQSARLLHKKATLCRAAFRTHCKALKQEGFAARIQQFPSRLVTGP